MARILQQFFLVVILGASVCTSSAFVALGPNNEPYQVPAIGYNPNANLGDGLPTGPKAIGEEYRRNTPVMYYSFDQNFIDYFGSNGMAAVDAAFAVLNGLTNVSSYSADLSEIPLESQRINALAQALSLLDLKSTTLFMMMEQLGLSEPDRYTWTIHSREHFGNVACPVGMQYLIIKRNIDPVTSTPNQFQYSSYVNGTLLTYQIVEYCTAANSPVPPMEADAREFQVDPLSPRYSAVASRDVNVGSYYTGLTRDDVGGLRYLLRANNLNIESAGANTVTFTTNNANGPSLLYTSNLTTLADASYQNDAATLAALFPGLQISSSIPYFTNVVTTTSVSYFTNSPFEPANAPARLVTANVTTTNITTYYRHQFANVITNSFSTNGTVTVVTTNISTTACSPFLPAGLVCISITSASYPTNGVFGDYYLIPTNQCGVSIIQTQLVISAFATNTTVATTNGVVNLVNQQFSQTKVYPYTQYALAYYPVTCPGNTVALRQGVERIQFVRRDFDSLVGQFFTPTTNTYVLNAVTNNTLVPQTVQRVVNQPDFLFSAEDLTGGAGSVTLSAFNRNVNFNTGNVLPNLAGPGTIETPTRISFNKVGPIYANSSPLFLEADQIPVLIWASFDGSTNVPVVYPNGASIVNIENQIFIQVSPTGSTLPNGHLSSNYTNVFVGFTVTSGATAPYTWTLSPTSLGLPPGLSLSAISGKISGVPTTLGVYDFSIRMSDATARYVDRPYTITVVP